jgi:hypothetical protein
MPGISALITSPIRWFLLEQNCTASIWVWRSKAEARVGIIFHYKFYNAFLEPMVSALGISRFVAEDSGENLQLQGGNFQSFGITLKNLLVHLRKVRLHRSLRRFEHDITSSIGASWLSSSTSLKYKALCMSP